jgi:glycosyltransferase involved in cell wall biosynthesis
VCGPAGLLCDPDDISTLAKNLTSAAFDDATRARLVAAADAQLATFSWARCAAELAALYHRLADEHSA